jgi:O-antigen ligase
VLLLRQNKWILIWSLLYFIVLTFLIWEDNHFLVVFPVGLIAVFIAIFHSETAFLIIAFCTPLSVNIEAYTNSFGLFIPTEPLLFGLMLLFAAQHFKKSIIPSEVWKSPIIWAVGFYLYWILITSITSTIPLTSFKFLLARLWFAVPLLLFAPIIFMKDTNIKKFIWLFSIGMCIVVFYTLIMHAQYRFGEKESHWVMWPFFKDHTIYGALVALTTPLIFGLYFSKKHSPFIQAILLGMMLLILLGLYFSYTRAAWLSVIAALLLMVVIKLKISFKLIASATIFLAVSLFFSWNTIQQILESNKEEHTTEQFGEKLQSATNVTTDASNLERINRWTSALDMFQEKPIVGFGPGTYASEYARFQRPENLTILVTWEMHTANFLAHSLKWGCWG